MSSGGGGPYRPTAKSTPRRGATAAPRTEPLSATSSGGTERSSHRRDSSGSRSGTRTARRNPKASSHGQSSPPTPGLRWITATARRPFKRGLKAAGLPGHFSPHSLRPLSCVPAPRRPASPPPTSRNNSATRASNSSWGPSPVATEEGSGRLGPLGRPLPGESGSKRNGQLSRSASR